MEVGQPLLLEVEVGGMPPPQVSSLKEGVVEKNFPPFDPQKIA